MLLHILIPSIPSTHPLSVFFSLRLLLEIKLSPFPCRVQINNNIPSDRYCNADTSHKAQQRSMPMYRKAYVSLSLSSAASDTTAFLSKTH
ncbi:hypothetical protein SAMN04488128_103751 [Chitinophaga eiseniae]|uniref:Uncharacterized protein n=1 Tax=Chitinophaga eiseniae TaxID=634771 RepID=A0A1T4SYL5_9BACT|nr:hypothetical protein SAMN04488128_103751 [Chitinophaga eiseniae]